MTRTAMNAEPFILRKATSYLFDRASRPILVGGAGPRSTMCRGSGSVHRHAGTIAERISI